MDNKILKYDFLLQDIPKPKNFIDFSVYASLHFENTEEVLDIFFQIIAVDNIEGTLETTIIIPIEGIGPEEIDTRFFVERKNNFITLTLLDSLENCYLAIDLKDLCLFKIGLEHQFALDEGYITKEVRSKFNYNGYGLSKNVEVTKENNKWIINDKENYKNYFVLIENSSLGIYLDDYRFLHWDEKIQKYTCDVNCNRLPQIKGQFHIKLFWEKIAQESTSQTIEFAEEQEIVKREGTDDVYLIVPPVLKRIWEQYQAHLLRIPEREIQPTVAVMRLKNQTKLYAIKFEDLIQRKRAISLKWCPEKTIPNIASNEVNKNDYIKLIQNFLRNLVPYINIETILEGVTTFSFQLKEVKMILFSTDSLAQKLNDKKLHDCLARQYLLEGIAELFMINTIYSFSGFEILIPKNKQNKFNTEILDQYEGKTDNEIQVSGNGDWKICFQGKAITFAFNIFSISMDRNGYIKTQRQYQSEYADTEPQAISYGESNHTVIENYQLSHQPIFFDIVWKPFRDVE